MKQLDSVNLTICFYDGDEVSIPLSSEQVRTVCKILMIEGNGTNNSVSMASDATLRKFWQMKGNPLRLQKAGETQ